MHPLSVSPFKLDKDLQKTKNKLQERALHKLDNYWTI